MQQIYGNVTKVLVESRQGSNLLYLPLDKIMQGVASGSGALDAPAATSPSPAVSSPATPAPTFSNDSRARDTSRTRERESR